MESQYAGLLSLLRRKLRDEQLAQDVLNTAIVTCLEHLEAGRVANPRQIGGYVFQVAMNQLRNHRRKMDERMDRRADPDAIEQLAAERSDPSGDSISLASRVRQVLEALPVTRDREIVKRFYLDEEDKERICGELGLSPVHFDRVIFRARQRMRAMLESMGIGKSDIFGFLIVCFA